MTSQKLFQFQTTLETSFLHLDSPGILATKDLFQSYPESSLESTLFIFNSPASKFDVVLIQCLGFICHTEPYATWEKKKKSFTQSPSFDLRCVQYVIHFLQKSAVNDLPPCFPTVSPPGLSL